MTTIYVLSYQVRKVNSLTNRPYWVQGEMFAYFTRQGAAEEKARMGMLNVSGKPRRYRHIVIHDVLLF